MTKKTGGLKQAVANAMAEGASGVNPVRISGDATRAMAEHLRKWSGWKNASLVWGDPSPVSPFAMCDHDTRTFTINADMLVLNPNRILNSVTPFRLRQEAVLTGIMLHEAGHARYSRWLPRSTDEVAKWTHSDGTKPTKQAVAFARLFEEARVEALMARDARGNGAAGLEWTMRASAAQLVPMTDLATEPDQRLMDLITSWVLRAGRQEALARLTNITTRQWVLDFTDLVRDQITEHIMQLDNADPWSVADSQMVMGHMTKMLTCTDNTGTTMIDLARDVLKILFPETDGDSDGAPMPGAGCGAGQGAGQESDDQTADQGSGGGQAQDEADEPGDGDSDSPGGMSGDGGTEDDSTEDDGTEGSGSGVPEDSSTEDEQDETGSALAAMLTAMEQTADIATESEAGTEQSKAPAPTSSNSNTPPDQKGTGAGSGVLDTSTLNGMGGWRTPTKSDRETQRNAEKFLRELIDPSDSSKVGLTDTPAARIDGAAMAAWKASGGTRDPRFFVRTNRIIEPSPPVKIAILVDVSMSMDVMQKPAALLSWALASAALDLRNFAGRGTQVESCLIHWGSGARVIQHNGQLLPGLREFPCKEYTDHLHEAFSLVGDEIPGFFTLSDKPENRLLINFTDWELGGNSERLASPWINTAMAAGVNMLSIIPSAPPYWSKLSWLMERVPLMRGRSEVLAYDERNPEAVWSEAARMLKR